MISPMAIHLRSISLVQSSLHKWPHYLYPACSESNWYGTHVTRDRSNYVIGPILTQEFKRSSNKGYTLGGPNVRHLKSHWTDHVTQQERVENIVEVTV